MTWLRALFPSARAGPADRWGSPHSGSPPGVEGGLWDGGWAHAVLASHLPGAEEDRGRGLVGGEPQEVVQLPAEEPVPARARDEEVVVRSVGMRVAVAVVQEHDEPPLPRHARVGPAQGATRQEQRRALRRDEVQGAPHLGKADLEMVEIDVEAGA